MQPCRCPYAWACDSQSSCHKVATRLPPMDSSAVIANSNAVAGSFSCSTSNGGGGCSTSGSASTPVNLSAGHPAQHGQHSAPAAAMAPRVERLHVQQFYDHVAQHFDHTRHSPWPKGTFFAVAIAFQCKVHRKCRAPGLLTSSHQMTFICCSGSICQSTILRHSAG